MTNPTQHGQVPEALIDLIDAYAETRHRCGGIYNPKTEAARKAVIEALSGVQALSAAPPALPPYPPLPMQFACSGVFAVYSADQMRAYVDADRAAYAPGSSQPAPAPLSDDVVRDAAFDAVRKKLCALPRFSFLSDGYGVRRVPDKSGSWIAFDAAHELFDPVAVDAALAAQGGQ